MKTFSKIEIIDRLKLVVNATSDTDLANALGIGKSTISNWRNRQTIDYDLAFSFCEHINLNWLLTGEGDMLKRDNSQELIPVAAPEGGIPLVPIDAWAGLFHGSQSVALAECERFFVPAFKDADFLIPVRGDSMIPRYYSGDLVACKYLPLSDIFFQWGKVYVLDTCQGALIKKVRPGRSDSTITLISENPEYEPFELSRKDIYNIAIEQGLIRSE